MEEAASQPEPDVAKSSTKLIAVIVVIIVIIALISGIFLFRGILSDGDYAFTDTIHAGRAANASTILQVSTVNGYIKILGWDDDSISITGYKRAHTQEDFDNIDLQIVELNNIIIIEVTHTTANVHSEGIDLDLMVPHDVTIQELDSVNGNIEVSGMSVIHEVDTTNGAINVDIPEMDGDVELTSTNGEIDVYVLATLDLDINMETVNGEISTGDLPLALSADEAHHKEGQLGNGGDNIEIRTTNGDIRLHSLT